MLGSDIAKAAHKAVYAVATGALADALVRPLPASSVERHAQGSRLKGFS